jgi:hypothetical protein
MVSKGCQRHHSFLEPLKWTETKKQLTSGTLSPDARTTTSSGYSTGGSTVSTTIVPSSKIPNQPKIKSKSKTLEKEILYAKIILIFTTFPIIITYDVLI